jgi:hypothetical protein
VFLTVPTVATSRTGSVNATRTDGRALLAGSDHATSRSRTAIYATPKRQ